MLMMMTPWPCDRRLQTTPDCLVVAWSPYQCRLSLTVLVGVGQGAP